LLADGMLFTVSSTGIMSCVDSVSGALHWRERIGGGEHYASLLACAGRIYAMDEQGEVIVLAASPEFEVLARNSLGKKVYASPAVDGARLLVRMVAGVVCFRAPAE
jgi:outer membrane protein assembly factor BamB